MQLRIIGITCISVLGIFVPATETTPIGSSFGNPMAFRPNSDQHAEFGEGVRDWVKNVRNRIFGGKPDLQDLPPPEAGKMMMELENEDPQNRKRYNGGFFLDLSNLKFDPETDWGFRLGQWYFIRKPSETRMTTESYDWKLPQPTYPEWPTMDNSRDGDNVPILTTTKSTVVMPTTVTMSSRESPEVTELQVPGVKTEDNETRNPKDDNQSTEVLLPSE